MTEVSFLTQGKFPVFGALRCFTAFGLGLGVPRGLGTSVLGAGTGVSTRVLGLGTGLFLLLLGCTSPRGLGVAPFGAGRDVIDPLMVVAPHFVHHTLPV